MNYFKHLKTSDKITLTFSLFNLFSLIFLLFSINIIYFFIWYSQIKTDSLYDMNTNYNTYLDTELNIQSNKLAFKKYILEKDTIVRLNWESEVICSPWVASKIHANPEDLWVLMDSFFYKSEGKIYFIFNTNYESIWDVSILYDTTDYFNSQIIIIKVSTVIIFIFLFLNYFFWKYISKNILKWLKWISKEVENLDLNKSLPKIETHWPETDEIRILWEALNESFSQIKTQSETQKQFITDVAHEFKTPLMVLNSKIDLYKKASSLWKKADLDKLLTDIKSWIKKLNKLLETMFLISRIQDNSISLTNKEICVKQTLEWLSGDLKILFSDKNIDFDININDELYLETDSSVFNILLENLLTNAIKFNNEDVKIKVYNEKNKLFIQDNWNWIESDKLKSIWEKFRRHDTNIEWFGIWLFLVKRIVEIYDWEIDIESEVWVWSKFIIKF